MAQINTKTWFSWPRVLAVLALMGLILIRLHLASAQTITLGYSSDLSLERGIIVSASAKDKTKIEATTQQTLNRLQGVVVDASDATLALAQEGQKTFVATTGQVSTLVNDQNGPIAVGDNITVSSVSGIGMKADNGEAIIVGKALATFDSKNNVLSTTKVKDSHGREKELSITRIAVELKIGPNPLVRPESSVPGFLRQSTSAIAQKPVGTIRIYGSAFVLLAAAAITVSMLYAGVRSAIVSIGRNPLSRKSILRGLIQVVVSSIVVFLCGLLGVYLLLKL